MALENKLGITDSAELARTEEKISKTKAIELFESSILNALTDKINEREIYMKGIDASYHYEGYYVYRTSEL